MKEIYSNVYQISLPLANNPLKEVHSYIIKGHPYSLLIDTGFNNQETKLKINRALKDLNIPLDSLKIFISHLHADHSGLASFFNQCGCEIFASRADADLMNEIISGNFKFSLEKQITLLDLDKYQINHNALPSSDPENTQPINFSILNDGDLIKIGDKELQVIDVSGHTPGMIALYDIKNKALFGADHILDQISPNIAYWGEEFPSLKVFLMNLKKLIPLKINTIYPSHRNEMKDHPRRAIELIDHHQERLYEIELILTQAKKALSASEVAEKMRWDFRAPSWQEFPKAQKFFATNEAMAHLVLLQEKGIVSKKIVNNIAYFYSS